MSTKLLESLRPTPVVKELRALTSEDFGSQYAGVAFLMVRIEDDAGALLQGLDAGAVAAATAEPLAFTTVIHSAVTRVASQTGAAYLEAHRIRLVRGNYYVVPLRKLSDAEAFSGRISVGRAHNKDVVLRDSSVSKFHGWFEVDGSGQYFYADAGSKNGSLRNGNSLAPKQLSRLDVGDELRLGSIEARFWLPGTLWDVIRRP